jgi:hypothetical protein
MGTVTHNVTTEEDFEPTPTGTITTDSGAGPGAGANPGLQYEGAESLIRRVQSTGSLSGFLYTLPATPGPVDFTAAATLVWWVKIFSALAAEIEDGGSRAHVGDTTTDLYAYQIGDDGTMGGGQFALSPKGGYVLLPIEVRHNAWRNLPDRGTNPDPTISDVFGVQHQVTNATGAGSTQSLDAIHTSTDGLFLVGSGSVFNDFNAADEGEGIAGTERVGMWTASNGVFTVYGTHVIGRTDAGVSTLTTFLDALQTIVFPGGFVGSGFNGFEIDCATASTAVTWTNISITGGGRARKIVLFDTDHDVDNTVDSIDITAHGFEDGDQIFYSAEGGTEDIGPDAINGEAEVSSAAGRGTGPYWYAIEGASADLLQLSAIADDAYSASPTAVVLTASTSGNGERHALIRNPDTRPDIVCIGTAAGATFDMVNCTVVGFRLLTMTSAMTITGGTYVGGDLLTVAGGLIDGATFIDPTPGVSEHFMAATATDLDSATDGVKNCVFTTGTGEGHAIKITSGSGAVALTGDIFTGYFDNDEDNTGGWAFNANTDVTGGATDTITITGHGFATADPIHYSDEGLTAITELTDNALYFIRSVDVNTVALYNTARAATDDVDRISLTPGVSEVHKLYSANAAVWNDTGLAVTLNIGGGGSGPSVRNTSGSTTLVVNTVTITITVVDQAGDPVENAQVWTAEGTDRDNPGTVLDNGDTNASGVRSFSFEFASPQPILISIRKSSTGSDRFVPVETSGTIDSGGFTLRRTLATDVNVLP